MSYKTWIIVAVSLFGTSFAIGWATPAGIVDLLSEDLAALKELGDFLVPFKVNTAIFLFIKNTSVLLISFVLSPILCLMPLLTLTVNGWLLAFISAITVQKESAGYLLVGLLPHGIFELPALILAQAAALSFGTAAMTALFKRNKKLLLANLNRNLKYLLIAIILLLPAAIIETYLTPMLLGTS